MVAGGLYCIRAGSNLICISIGSYLNAVADVSFRGSACSYPTLSCAYSLPLWGQEGLACELVYS